MILILTCPGDATADLVAKKLQERGADFIRLDNSQFPAQAELSVTFAADGRMRHLLRQGEEILDLSRVTAAWYRRPLPPVPHTLMDSPLAREYTKGEAGAFLNGVWQSLDCFWVPAKRSELMRAEDKLAQLRLAGTLGFELPPTLVTNSPEDFQEFYQRHQGLVVSKIIHNPLLLIGGNGGVGYEMKTTPVSSRDVGYARSIRYCPTIFQAYVPKSLELRITVVGRQVFACEIHSQQTHHTRHDWRRYDIAHTPHRIHELPEEWRERCLQLVAGLGLCYGAIDMVLTPDGRYVFLEINPNGQYAWVERLTRLPMSDAICDLLMSRQTAATAPTATGLSAPGMTTLQSAAPPSNTPGGGRSPL